MTRDQWLRALGGAMEPPDPTALTLAELAAMFQYSRQHMSRKVQTLIDAGRAIRTSKIVTYPSGLTRREAGYRLVESSAPRRRRQPASR